MATYRPEIFNVRNLDEAKRIILTPEPHTTTEERWEKETPYLVQQIGSLLKLNEHSLVLDYGCGVGRVAKGLIEHFGCSVIGVDFSLPMRQLAPGYVDSNRFFVLAPESFDHLLARGLRVDHAFSIWVLQHCLQPQQDVQRIARAVSQAGGVYLLNNIRRAVPSSQGWADDGIDIHHLMLQSFIRKAEGQLPLDVVTELTQACTFWGLYQKGNAGEV